MRLNANILEAEKNETTIERGGTTDVNNWTNSEEVGRYFCQAISIQRAWRSYKNNRLSIDKSSSKNSIDQLDKDETSESDNCIQMMSLATPDDYPQNPRIEDDPSNDPLDHDTGRLDDAEEFQFAERKGCGLPYSLAARCGIESEPESIVSDYSEMADPIKEHLANVQIIQKEDLDLGNAFVNNFLVQPKIFRGDEEDEEEFNKRVRKTNYLSLAQEFAELKKVDASALPFGLHKDEYKTVSPLSDGDSGSDLDSADHCRFDSSGFEIGCQGDHDMHCALDDETNPEDGNAEVGYNEGEDEKNTDKPDEKTAEIAEDKHEELVDTSQSSAAERDSLSCKVLPGKADLKSKELGSNLHCKKSLHQAPTSASDAESLTTGHESDNSSFTDSPVRVKMTRKRMDESLGEFDIYTVETALPQMDWQHLEEQLQKAAEEEQQKWSHCGDREQIRRKLAMPIEDDAYDSELPLRKPSLQTRLQTNMNLHVCYVNEAAETTGSTHDPVPPAVNLATTYVSNSAPDVLPVPSNVATAGVVPMVDPYENEDFFAKQARLQAEAKMALAQVRPMAHMQLQLEKQLKKKSPLAEIVGIPGFINGKFRHLSSHLLQQMNFAQIQVVVNDLHAQIEVLNSELMQQLVERDDLHMAQDSMLVDIEDLTGRAQEFAARVNKRSERKESFAK